MTRIPEGTLIHCPDGGGLKLKQDLNAGEYLSAEMLEPFGGVAYPIAEEPIPEWFILGLLKEKERIEGGGEQ